MGNIIKFNETRLPNSIKSGGFNVGVNNTPTDLTGFYNGITPILSGYTIYIDKVSNGPSIYAPQNDNELVGIVNSLGGSVSTATEALVWINSQSNMTVVNGNYPSIVTDGLVLNLDAGFVSSYPRTGTTWTDLSGSGNTGTLINGPTFSSGNGGSIVFDGVDDYITNIGTTSTFSFIQNTGIFTICAWVKLNDFSSSRSIMGNNDLTGGQRGFSFIYPGTSNALRLALSNGSGTTIVMVRDNFFTNTDWVFVTAVGNGTTCQFYRNGVSFSTSGTFGTFPTGNSARVLSVGRINNINSSYWNGNISQTSIYNRALTPQEILQNYYAGLQRFIPTNGLVLSLDAQNTNTTTNITYDTSGNNNNGTLLNGTQYISDGNGSWSFDGVDDYITNIGTTSTFSFIQNTGIFTICAWVKLNDFSVPGYFMGNNDGTASQKGFYLGYPNIQNRLWLSITYGVSGQATLNLQRENFFTDNNWVFVTAVGNGTTCQFYRNGVSFSTSGTFGTFSTGDSRRTLSVGRINNSLGSASYWKGNVSQTSIYNRALTQDEITTIFNATRTRYGL
jgi:hypothetical protein